MAAFTSPMAKPQLKSRAPCSARPFQLDMHLQHKLPRPSTVRAVNMYVLPEDKVLAKDKHDTSKLVSESEHALLADLQLRFEDMWHEYAAARKRNMKLQIEKEELETQLRNANVALKQEQCNCRRAEEKAALLAARLEVAEGHI